MSATEVLAEYHLSREDLCRMDTEDTCRGVTLHKRGPGFETDYVRVTIHVHHEDHLKAQAANELYAAVEALIAAPATANALALGWAALGKAKGEK